MNFEVPRFHWCLAERAGRGKTCRVVLVEPTSVMYSVSAREVLERFAEGVPAYFTDGMIPHLRGGAIIAFSRRGLAGVILLGEGEERGMCLGWRPVRMRCWTARHVGPNISLSLGGPLGRGPLGVLYGAGNAPLGLACARIGSACRTPFHLDGFTAVSFSHGGGATPSFRDGLAASLNMDLPWFMGWEEA